MPSFADNRALLSVASSMLYIGGISDVRKPDPNFQPQVSNYGLYDTFYTMTGTAQLSDCDRVNKAAGDSAMDGRILPWVGASGSGDLLTISDGMLRISKPGEEVMLLRNCQPGSAITLLDVVSFDPNVYEVAVLSYGDRVNLKWGDTVVVKPSRSSFHSVSAKFPSLEPFEDVHDTWSVYVCVPEFQHKGAYEALQIPGVCREIRERVESFVSIWDAAWDVDGLVVTRNGPRQQAYAAQRFSLLEQHTGRVSLFEDCIVGFSSMVVGDATKRALEDGGDGTDCKRAKH